MNDQPTNGFTYYGKSPKGVEMALTLDVSQFPTVAALANYLTDVDAQLSAKGFTRSDRLDRPVYGGGGGGRQPRPEIAPPAGVVRPEHCGQPMKYVRYRKDGAKGFPERGVEPGFADMWTCSKDKQCANYDAEKNRTFANFDMKPAAPPQNGQQQATRPSQPPSEMGYGDFLNQAIKEGQSRGQCIKLAGVQTDDELRALGAARWRQLLAEMRGEVAAA